MIIEGGDKKENSKIIKWFYLKRLSNQRSYNKYITKSIIKKRLINQKIINTQTREENHS